jgi:hypothetical protein
MPPAPAQRAHSTIGRTYPPGLQHSGRQSWGAAVHYFSITYPQINFEVQLHESEKDIAAHLDLFCGRTIGVKSASR